ncbi:hypothetical protein ACLMJK_000543 [Lecanora helva]
MVRSDSLRSRKLQRLSWFRVVLDEAHHIRNRAGAFDAISQLNTERRWCLTGTPVQNSLYDLFALTEFLRFYPFEDRQGARRWILDPLGKKEESGLKNLQLLVRTISLRRSRDSVLDRPRLDEEVAVVLSAAERERYNSVRAHAHEMVISNSKSSCSKNLFSCIHRMRQMCSNGMREAGSTSTLSRLRSKNTMCNKCLEPILQGQDSPVNSPSNQPFYCSECIAEEDNATDWIGKQLAVPDSQQDLSKSMHLLRRPDFVVEDNTYEEDVDMYARETAFVAPEACSKLHSIIEKLDELDCQHHKDFKPVKSLVFSTWTTTLNTLERCLSRKKMKSVRIDGSVSLDQRRTAIECFQSDDSVKIMLLTFGSGSVGLNLTSANHVHLVEPHWNPMVEAQAAARVDRLDQDKRVHIWRYLVQDSIEQTIKASQRRKLWLAKLSRPCATAAEDREIADSIEDLKLLCTGGKPVRSAIPLGQSEILLNQRNNFSLYKLTAWTYTHGVYRGVVAVGPDAIKLKPGNLVFCDVFVSARDDQGGSMLMGLSSGSPQTRPLMDGEWRHSTWAEYAKFPLENLFALDEEALLERQGYSIGDLCTLSSAMVGYGGLDDIGLKAGERIVIAPATGQFGGAAVGVALQMGAIVVAMGRNQDTLKRLNNTFGSTGRLTTVTMTNNVESDTSTLQAASPSGYSAYLDLSPPVAAENTYSTATLSLLNHGGRVSMMGNFFGGMFLPGQLMIRGNLKVFGKWMYSREQARNCIQMAEAGVLALGRKAGVVTEAVYGLEEIQEAVDKAAEVGRWGVQVLVEPNGRSEGGRLDDVV